MLALRSRDALLAGVAGFIAWGYATDWFPAIRFAGHGLVAGALLSCAGLVVFVLSVQIPIYAPVDATASASSPAALAQVTAATLSSTRRAPSVAFASPDNWIRECAALRARRLYKPVPLYPTMPRVSAALDTLLASILRENVRSWFRHISQPGPLQDQTFPNSVDATVRLALGNLRDRLLAIDDVVEVLTSRLVPLLTAHFHDFNEAERAIRGRKLNRSVTESDELDLAIAARYRELREARAQAAGKTLGTTGSGLHSAAQLSYSDANTKLAQQDYLRRVVGERVLPRLLPDKFLASRPVAALVREIVACAVLYPLLQLLADPDTYNQLMENYGRTMLQDRSTVRRLRAALDQHASSSGAVLGGSGRTSLTSQEGGTATTHTTGSGRSGVPPTAAFPRLAPGDSERRFERFIRAIRTVNNLSDARRFRSEVASQLKRDSQQQIQDLHKNGGGVASSPETMAYLRRLEMSKRLLDQKVQYLAAGGDSRHATLNGGSGNSSAGNGHAGSGLDSNGGPGTPGGGPSAGVVGLGIHPGPTVSRLETASLSEVLRDASGLSYFMEYMDRLCLMPLVQFWLVVDGLRNPLEEDDEDDDDSRNNGNDRDRTTLPASARLPWTEADRLDLAQIDQAYLARPELHVSAAARQTVRAFLGAGTKASPEQYYRARQAVLRSQVAVLNEMQARHFQSFKKSDLFYKCLAAEEAAQQRQARTSVSLERAASPLTLNVPTMPLSANTNAATAAANSKPLPLKPANRLLRGTQAVAGPGVGSGAESGLAKRAASAIDVRVAATTAAATQAKNHPAQDEPLFGRRSLDGGIGGGNKATIDNASSSAALFGGDDDIFTSPRAGGGRNGSLSNSNGNLATPASDPMSDSVPSLVGDGDVPDTRVVQAVEQALTTIMEDKRPTTAEDLRASLFGTEGAGSSIGSDGGGNDRGSIFSGMDGDDRGKTTSGGSEPARRGSTPNPNASSQNHNRVNQHAHALLLHGDNSGKPSLASLGLVSAASRIGVFEDDDLFGDDQAKYLSDDDGDGGSDLAGSGLLNGLGPKDREKDKDMSGLAGGNSDSDEDGVHEAAPGDLGLVEAIAALSDDIDRLSAQDAVVDSLLRKAELTNNTAELRILRKSKASLMREIRRKELQRQQYALQETDNSLYGRATVRLTDVQSGREEDTGKEYAQYVIEVQRVSDFGPVSDTPVNDGRAPTVAWTVIRRYSAFWALHQLLRSRYPSVRALDFPRRRVVLNKLQGDFLQKRRVALEGYLRALLLLPDVCRSRELRAFLSQRVITNATHADRTGSGLASSAAAAAAAADAASFDAGRRDVISRLYESVADGMEDILGSIPVLDQLSTAGQNLIAAATSQLSGGGAAAQTATAGQNAATAAAASAASAEAAAELAAATSALPGESAPFVKPICDIFLEIFELNRGNNWLRGRAVVVVLHQLLGGTIERKLRENVRTLLQEEEALLKYLGLVQDALFPASGVKPPPRTAAQKARTRTEAGLMLATLVPDLAGSVVGRVNAQAASRRIFATFNNSRLNAHLAFTIFDEAIDVLFSAA
ncbi:tRNA (guanine-N(7)-)-methyltransferase (tRNA(m7G46)-methyltransferase) [Sporothrix epigloea]|uniref:tRNA (Guanine-N(7)-)-methyltransferase (tRNA(m7G46)-methyltransferase) n=1 Tax=Sporothrix epigloea TaxID=1892477 RepID=A0ABP0DWN4_9PEZI